MVLEIAYTRRMQFEARVHAIATVELLAQALTGKSGRQGITKDGRVFTRASAEDGLAQMGVFL